jgi:predicted 3-demethylubiquinone-9 3-methyltransferase (glyoxalase superfamily)
MDEMLGDKDTERGKRVANAMLKMVKLDIAKLKAAYEGR